MSLCPSAEERIVDNILFRRSPDTYFITLKDSQKIMLSFVHALVEVILLLVHVLVEYKNEDCDPTSIDSWYWKRTPVMTTYYVRTYYFEILLLLVPLLVFQGYPSSHVKFYYILTKIPGCLFQIEAPFSAKGKNMVRFSQTFIVSATKPRWPTSSWKRRRRGRPTLSG